MLCMQVAGGEVESTCTCTCRSVHHLCIEHVNKSFHYIFVFCLIIKQKIIYSILSAERKQITSQNNCLGYG